MESTNIVYDQLGDGLQKNINEAVALVREVSMQTDPQEMVRKYREREQRRIHGTHTLSLSRRDLQSPHYRITRSTTWAEEFNPWTQADRLPVLNGGLLADLIYGNKPVISTDVCLDHIDPAAEYFEGIRAFIAIPLFERGESLNMVVLLYSDPSAVQLEEIPNIITTANLFGRATSTLVIAEKLRQSYEALDAEFRTIAKIQQTLLPQAVPTDVGLDVNAYYRTANRAGGDYYDFFPLSKNRVGIMVADVSGHGAAAAVVMARMHAALHAGTVNMGDPGEVLTFANEHLLMNCQSMQEMTNFVTAFYAVFNPTDKTLTYSSAGHNPPRYHPQCCSVSSIAGARDLPLGITCGIDYQRDTLRLESNDMLVLFTDGIVESENREREQFGVDRLDFAISSPNSSAKDITRNVLRAVEEFTEGAPPVDDRTLLSLRVS
jgi:phosphoserine phosphatase RsbU/P